MVFMLALAGYPEGLLNVIGIHFRLPQLALRSLSFFHRLNSGSGRLLAGI